MPPKKKKKRKKRSFLGRTFWKHCPQKNKKQKAKSEKRKKSKKVVCGQRCAFRRIYSPHIESRKPRCFSLTLTTTFDKSHQTWNGQTDKQTEIIKRFSGFGPSNDYFKNLQKLQNDEDALNLNLKIFTHKNADTIISVWRKLNNDTVKITILG